MATKDPAILWYYNDYLGGTEGMTFEQQGAYVRLLNHQMDKGHLALSFIQAILGPYYKKVWPVISQKFLVDAAGHYYNQRVDEEKEKRANYLARQRGNGAKGGRPPKKDKTHGLRKQNPRVTDSETHGFEVGSEWVNPNESTRVENENKDGLESLAESKVAKERVVSLIPVEGTITGVEIESKVSKREKSYKKFTREEFTCDVQLYADRYPQAMLDDFIRYWSEPDDRGRMRFQKQDTWSTPGRLVTWNNNNKNKFYGSHLQTPAGGTSKPGTSAARIDTARNW